MTIYDPVGTECVGFQPGTEALMAVLVEDYGTADSGTYVCKHIDHDPDKPLSFHAEGRAGDSSGYPDRMRRVADLLVANWQALGVQEVIYDQFRWSTDDGTPGWEPFGGSDPHTSHVHWSLTWDAAKNLTVEAIRAILNPISDPLEGSAMRTVSNPYDTRPNPKDRWKVRLVNPRLLRCVNGGTKNRIKVGKDGPPVAEVTLPFDALEVEDVGAGRVTVHGVKAEDTLSVIFVAVT